MDECVAQRWDNAVGDLMYTITLKDIVDEDFVNYKVPSMTLMFPKCNFKCDTEAGTKLCHNSSLVQKEDVTVNVNRLCERYLNNPITKAVCLQGLEPMDSYGELILLVSTLRLVYGCTDDIVIYTGYNKSEITKLLEPLMLFPNIIVKYGRFVMGDEPHFDGVLGVNLASDNQYAEIIRR